MSVALLGVVAMQLYFLRQSYLMQSELFDRSVNEALANVVNKVSKQDAVKFLNDKARVTLLRSTTHYNLAKNADTVINLHKLKKSKRPLTIREKRIALLRDSLKRMITNKKMDDELEGMLQNGAIKFQVRIDEYTDEFGIVRARLTPEIVRGSSKSVPDARPHVLHKYDTLHYVYSDPQFGKQVISVPQINPLWQQEQARKAREKQFKLVKRLLQNDSLQNVKPGNTTTVIENLAEEYQTFSEPLKGRLNAVWIDTLLRFELHNQGIFLPYSFEILTANNDSLIFSKAMDMAGIRPVFIPANTYQTSIFSKDVIRDPGKIKISFPQKNSLIINRMTATMATTGSLLLILVFCMGYTIFSIIKQKKISEMKTDFINNMTHEFKTPVSTIMIASEALRDNEIVADKARVSRLANIIYEENARLGSHIERVLNVARIEKNDFKLDKKPLDVNEMISIVIDSMALKLQKHNVQLTLNLNAVNAIVLADELHFSNLIYNLIDNAIKYSASTPEITISTTDNKTGQIVINVADNGIGMSRDQQTKIFEQFYRIPTGNLHDVKGFGLGLSYVNTIVKRLNGVISVRSEKDKGSDFELKFPLAG